MRSNREKYTKELKRRAQEKDRHYQRDECNKFKYHPEGARNEDFAKLFPNTKDYEKEKIYLNNRP